MSSDPAPDGATAPTGDGQTAAAAPERPHGVPFFVVGVGASAGGIEAVSRLAEHLPADPGMAFIVVLHLDPHRESLVPDILARSSKMPVHEATDGTTVEPNHVYVIPPNATVALTDHRLIVVANKPVRSPHMPIDYLFRSLAEAQKRHAVGVVLSGGGTDGTLGLQEISAAEGITFAQDEYTARHPSMPRSAAASGCIDFILPPDDIARELLRIARHPYAGPRLRQQEPAPEEKDDLGQIFGLIRRATGVDFSQYKQNTIERRVRRRMALRNLESLADYRQYLDKDPAEVRALYQDFLIRVTSFFRDPVAFAALKQHVFPHIVEDRSPGSPIRLWVAGCSTGEEAYSIAIALLEYLGDMATNTPVKILATDVNEVALDKARSGIYVENIELDVSPEQLRRFFVRVNGSYQISKSIREMCVFSRHNLLRDPPFSKLDLVSCRNLLIYLNLAQQKQVLSLFHYALKADRYLMLGPSESIGTSNLFEQVNDNSKIYVRKGGVSPALTAEYQAEWGTYGGPTWATSHGPAGLEPQPPAPDLQKEADRFIVQKFGPPGVVVDENLNVLHFRGQTGPYLEHGPGAASLNLLRMAREGLIIELRKVVAEAKAKNGLVRSQPVLVKRGDSYHPILLEAAPLPTGGTSHSASSSCSRTPPPPPHRPGRPRSGRTKKARRWRPPTSASPSCSTS